MSQAVAEVIGQAHGRARWIGFGPLSNLAALLAGDPGLSRRLAVTQLGGLTGTPGESGPCLPLRNFRLDPAAASIVLEAAWDLRLVNVGTAFARYAAIVAGSPVSQRLTGAGAPPWAALVAAHCAQFFAHYHPAVIPASPLALSAALHRPFTRFWPASVAVDRAGRMVRAEDRPGRGRPAGQDVPPGHGRPADRRSMVEPARLVGCDSDWAAFGRWLEARLRPVTVVWPGRRAGAKAVTAGRPSGSRD